MKYSIIIIFIVQLFFSGCSSAQESIAIGFYNLENFFDISDDTTNPADDEFLPLGKKQWDDIRFNKKMSDISKIIRLMNNGNTPDILGFCESESKDCIIELNSKYLNGLGYELVYFESDDSRKIDVGLLFKKKNIKLLESTPIRIDSVKNTRDILYAKLECLEDTLHIFVNHWPSRRGGEAASEKLRNYAASILKSKVDELLNSGNTSKIVIIGDFNDMPDNNSIKEILGAKPIGDCKINNGGVLFNTGYNRFINKEGTYFYQGNFNMLDQVIISKDLLNKLGKLNYICDSYEIFKNEINTTKTGKYMGAPHPTFAGDRYLGGVSDHFPVFIKLEYSK